MWNLLSLPSTPRLFADTLEHAGDTFDQWSKGIPDTPEGKEVREMGAKTLRGQVRRRGGKWFWQFGDSKQVDIDMASSGQKANWPLVVLGEALFTWRQQKAIEEPFYLHVEEPEIHLHPAAQVAIVELLAYL